MKLLKDPYGYIRAHSDEELISYASLVYEDIHKGIITWWKNNKYHYQHGRGGAHFWQRVIMKELEMTDDEDDNEDELIYEPLNNHCEDDIDIALISASNSYGLDTILVFIDSTNTELTVDIDMDVDLPDLPDLPDLEIIDFTNEIIKQ